MPSKLEMLPDMHPSSCLPTVALADLVVHKRSPTIEKGVQFLR